MLIGAFLKFQPEDHREPCNNKSGFSWTKKWGCSKKPWSEIFWTSWNEDWSPFYFGSTTIVIWEKLMFVLRRYTWNTHYFLARLLFLKKEFSILNTGQEEEGGRERNFPDIFDKAIFFWMLLKVKRREVWFKALVWSLTRIQFNFGRIEFLEMFRLICLSMGRSKLE